LSESDRELCRGQEESKAIDYLDLAVSQPDRYEEYGIVEKGSLCAFCSVVHLRSPRSALSEIAYIHTISRLRRRGYAKRLLVHVFSHMQSQGRCAIFSYDSGNEASRHLAESVGYRVFLEDFGYEIRPTGCR